MYHFPRFVDRETQNTHEIADERCFPLASCSSLLEQFRSCQLHGAMAAVQPPAHSDDELVRSLQQRLKPGRGPLPKPHIVRAAIALAGRQRAGSDPCVVDLARRCDDGRCEDACAHAPRPNRRRGAARDRDAVGSCRTRVVSKSGPSAAREAASQGGTGASACPRSTISDVVRSPCRRAGGT